MHSTRGRFTRSIIAQAKGQVKGKSAYIQNLFMGAYKSWKQLDEVNLFIRKVISIVFPEACRIGIIGLAFSTSVAVVCQVVLAK